MKGTDHYAELLGIKFLKSKTATAKSDENIKATHQRNGLHTRRSYLFTSRLAFAEACNFGDNIAVGIQFYIIAT